MTVPSSSSRTGPPFGRLIIVPASGRGAWVARRILVDVVQLLADVGRGEPEDLQASGIKRDQKFAFDAADPLDRTHAVDVLQLARDDIVDKIRQLLRRLVGRDRGIGENAEPDRIDPLDLAARRSPLGNVLLIRAIAALTSVKARSVFASRPKVIVVADTPLLIDDMICFTPATAATASSIGLVTCDLELRGWRTNIGDDNRDKRRIDIGEKRDRQLPEAHSSERQSHEREDDRRQRPTN